MPIETITLKNKNTQPDLLSIFMTHFRSDVLRSLGR